MGKRRGHSFKRRTGGTWWPAWTGFGQVGKWMFDRWAMRPTFLFGRPKGRCDADEGFPAMAKAAKLPWLPTGEAGAARVAGTAGGQRKQKLGLMDRDQVDDGGQGARRLVLIKVRASRTNGTGWTGQTGVGARSYSARGARQLRSTGNLGLLLNTRESLVKYPIAAHQP